MTCLFIHAGALGDFVLALRVMAALRRVGCDAVTLLGRQHISEIADPPDGPDKVLDIEAGGFHTLFAADAELPAAVGAQLHGFDLAVDMLGDSEGPLPRILRRVGIPRTITIDPRPRPDWAGHVSDQWLADLRAAGIDADVGSPHITIDDARLHAAGLRLRKECSGGLFQCEGVSGIVRRPRGADATGDGATGANATGDTPPTTRIAVLHPGSGGRAKCWPLPNWLGLAARLRDAAWQVLFLIGPVERERFSRDDLARLRDAAPVVDNPPLRETAALLAVADLFIGNDSGVSHLAAAVGTPTIAVFGPSNPDLYRPLGEHVAIARASAPSGWPGVDEVAALVLDAENAK